MLAQIIHQIQNLKRVHGKCPNVLYLTSDQYQVLREHHPERFTDAGGTDDFTPMGLKVVIAPRDCLQHPRVACVLPGTSQIYR